MLKNDILEIYLVYKSEKMKLEFKKVIDDYIVRNYNINVNYLKSDDFDSINDKSIDFLFVEYFPEIEEKHVNWDLYGRMQQLNPRFTLAWLILKNGDEILESNLLERAADYAISFSSREKVFQNKINAIIRRRWNTSSKENVIIWKGIVFDNDQLSISINSNPINLTPKEIRTLHYLLKNATTKWVRKHDLFTHVWELPNNIKDNSRSLDQIIYSLRLKFSKFNLNYIDTSSRGWIRLK